jgi:YfiR/HmsC-like
MRRLSTIVFLVGLATIARSQDYKLHPVYIYSFTKYVIWPDGYKAGDFEIVVLGESPIIKELNTMASLKKTPDNRAIVIKKIDNPADIKKCNVLYVPAGKSKMLLDVMTKVGTQSILIITEEVGLGSKGSNINFIIKDGKLAFEMNQGSMNKQSLKASSELSRLAIQI